MELEGFAKGSLNSRPNPNQKHRTFKKVPMFLVSRVNCFRV